MINRLSFLIFSAVSTALVALTPATGQMTLLLGQDTGEGGRIGVYGKDYQYVFGGDPGSGWQTQGFDHSSWQVGLTPFSNQPIGDYWGPDWHWDTWETYFPENSTGYLYAEIQLAAPADLVAWIAIDNAVDLYVNGQHIWGVDSEGTPWHWEFVVPIPAQHTRPGVNAIALRIHDRGAAAGFDMALFGPRAALPSTGSLGQPAPPPSSDDLRELADQRGKLFGAALQQPYVDLDCDSPVCELYQQKFRRSFNMATFENAHKAEAIWTGEHEYNWGAADDMVRWCSAFSIGVKFHALVWDQPYQDDAGIWHNQGVPDFLLNGSYTQQQVRDLLRDYIYATIDHYSGWNEPDLQILHFDVVNEYLHRRKIDGDPDNTREFWWKENAGDDIFSKAYEWAADASVQFGIPDAVLLYNDFGIEDGIFDNDGDRKVQDLARLLEANLEVIDEGWLDGIGLQAHLCDRDITSQSDPWLSDVDDVLYYFSDIYGLDMYISEFDAPGATHLRDTYYNFAEFCIEHPRVAGFQMWNWWDGDTWYGGGGKTGCDYCDDGGTCHPGIYRTIYFLQKQETYGAFEDALQP